MIPETLKSLRFWITKLNPKTYWIGFGYDLFWTQNEELIRKLFIWEQTQFVWMIICTCNNIGMNIRFWQFSYNKKAISTQTRLWICFPYWMSFWILHELRSNSDLITSLILDKLHRLQSIKLPLMVTGKIVPRGNWWTEIKRLASRWAETEREMEGLDIIEWECKSVWFQMAWHMMLDEITEIDTEVGEVLL